MGRGTLAPLYHPTHFLIMVALSQKENSSYGIAKLLNKSQSNIYEQMRKLEEENYIIPTEKRKFELNLKKLKEEYLDVFYSSDDERVSKLPPKEEILNNKYFIFVFNDYLKKYYENITEIANYENITLFEYQKQLSKALYYAGLTIGDWNFIFELIKKSNVSFNVGADLLLHEKWDTFIYEKDKELSTFRNFISIARFIIDLPEKLVNETTDEFRKYKEEQTKKHQTVFKKSNPVSKIKKLYD